MGSMSKRCSPECGSSGSSVSRSLAAVKQGCRVRILFVGEGCSLRTRLAEMGLFPGVEVVVVRNSSSGPFVIGMSGTRMVLGRGVAGKIEVG